MFKINQSEVCLSVDEKIQFGKKTRSNKIEHELYQYIKLIYHLNQAVGKSDQNVFF